MKLTWHNIRKHPLCIKLFKGVGFYYEDYIALNRQLKNNNDFKIEKFFPCLMERNSESGVINGHYFHQDFLVARLIYRNNPNRHIDIGSRVDGFVTHVASFREIEVFDIRPLKINLPNIIFRQADLMNPPKEMIGKCESISSLHAIEHFGLGRYSDPVDADGHVKAIENIHSMLKPGGIFYLSVPIGRQRIEFNAHRVFDVSYLLRLFMGKFVIESFSYVDDKGDLFENVNLDKDKIESNFGCVYGCGIFQLKKTPPPAIP